MEKTTTYTMRVPEDLKNAFEQAAKYYDLSGAQIMRARMKEVVQQWMKETAQGDLLKQTQKVKK